MRSHLVWPNVLFVASSLAAVLVAGWILAGGAPGPEGVVALVATVPFIVLARFSWSRMRRQREA